MGSNILDLENRKKVYDFILSNPGVHLRSIARKTDLSLSVVRHHVTCLERDGLVTSQKDRNLKVFFSNGNMAGEDRRLASLMQQKRFRDIMMAILLEPGITHTEITERLNIKPSTLSKYIGIMEDSGVIKHTKDGRNKHYIMNDESMVVRLLLRYRRSFLDSLVDSALDIYFER